MSLFQWSTGERSAMATKSHERTYAVLFDIADQGFTHYTRFEWASQLNEWASELRTSGYNVSREINEYEEVVELMGGDEWFVTFIED
mgnify:CR=1 FL=1